MNNHSVVINDGINPYSKLIAELIERHGRKLVLAIPIGIGKPLGFVNAIYQFAKENPRINLTIITGLTFSRPKLTNHLEKRFAKPIIDRLLHNYVDPLYEHDRELECVPNNINILEFFLQPGKFLNNRLVQENYISTPYSSALKDLLFYGVNIIAQQVAPGNDSGYFSLGSNTDLFHDGINELKKHHLDVSVIAEVNNNMPFMLGSAVIPASTFTTIIHPTNHPALFSIPHEPLSMQEHLIGLYTSCLIKDDGCLQIGIGKLSNALANALILRHQHNEVYLELLTKLKVMERFGDIIEKHGDLKPFKCGLYASTELISDEYLQLYKAGILKKRVYDHLGLQTLLNNKVIDEVVDRNLFLSLIEHGLINTKLKAEDILFLTQYGIFKPTITYKNGKVWVDGKDEIDIDLNVAENVERIVNRCLGQFLQGGKIVHAGFFIGSHSFYHDLKSLDQSTLAQIEMTSIAFTNTLSVSPQLLSLQRKNGRFVNSALMVTVAGAVISDGLENMNELSGVGGQYDFAEMARNLPDARFIINCRSTRTSKHLESNVLWQYPNLTLPRYLRDIIVTEYGIADCRSKTDSETIKSILNITDAHFQPSLLKLAKKYKKVSLQYQIPDIHTQFNHYQHIDMILSNVKFKAFFSPFPFGTDLTPVEQVLSSILLSFKKASVFKKLKIFIRSLLLVSEDKHYKCYLLRMDLMQTKTVSDFFLKKIIKYLVSKKQIEHNHPISTMLNRTT